MTHRGSWKPALGAAGGQVCPGEAAIVPGAGGEKKATPPVRVHLYFPKSELQRTALSPRQESGLKQMLLPPCHLPYGL